jgi:phage protein D
MKPDFNVTLDGTRLDGEAKGAISGVRVYLTHSGASAFELVVDDPELRWQAKPTFTESREVQIELGVPGKMKKVFDGEVTAWRTELERSGPTVLVLRGMDRSHRLMRGHRTKTYAEASPIDCAQQIASAAGLTAKTSAGQPAPVKTFRLQANESDFSFLRKLADLEGYLFYVDGSDLHFERPKLSSKDDLTVTFGEDLKTFLPVANFRRPAAKVEVGAWDSTGKAALTGKASPGDELWSVPGGKPGADVAKFQGTKASLGLVESQVATQEHADTVAKAALTRRSLEFLTAEVEVQGNPEIKPGAMVNVKKVGVYSGHYLVTEANHFYDAAGYNCIFYVARDKWGDSSTDEEKKKRDEQQKKQANEGTGKPYKPPKEPPKKPPEDDTIDFTLEGDDGKPFANVKCKIKLKSGEVIEATTDGHGHVHVDKKPQGPYTVEITGDALELTSIDVAVEDPQRAPLAGAAGKVKLSDGTDIEVTTDADGTIHLSDVPKGEYTLTLDAPSGGADGPADGEETPAGGAAVGGGPARGAGGAAAGGGSAPAAGGAAAGGGSAPAPSGAAAGGGSAPAPGGATAGSGAAPAAGKGSAPAAGGVAAGGGSVTSGGGTAAGRGAASGGAAAPAVGSGGPAPAAGAPKSATPAAAGTAPAPVAGPGTTPVGAAGTGAAGGGAPRAPGGKETAPPAGRGRAGVDEPASPRPIGGVDAGTGGKQPGPRAPASGATAPAAPGAGPAPAAAKTPAASGAPTVPATPATPAGASPATGTAAPPPPARTPAQSGGVATASPAPPSTNLAAAPAPAATAPRAPAAPSAVTAAAQPAAASSGAPASAPAPSAAAPPTPVPATVPTSTSKPGAEGLSPVEIGGIGAGVAAIGSVSAGIASAAGVVESAKATAESAAKAAKPPDSENVEE